MPPTHTPQRRWRLSLALSGAVLEPTPYRPHRLAHSSSISFTRDVAPIIQKNCQLCHSPGGIGPMPLLTYEHARRHGPLIKQMGQSREMPPYQYDTHIGIQQLQHDWRPSKRDIATMVQWVDDGMPESDPAAMPPAPKLPDPAEYRLAATYGPPDLVIKAAKYNRAARAVLERTVERRPDDPQAHSELGFALAGLGLKEAPLAEATQAVALVSVSVDAVVGPEILTDLARIQSLVGEREAALDTLEQVVSIPHALHVLPAPFLERDPAFAALRGDPRFRRVVERSR